MKGIAGKTNHQFQDNNSNYRYFFDKAQNDESIENQEKANKNKLRILVVEDNLLVQIAVKGMLVKLGHEADFAVDGYSALKLFNNAYDLILMDIDLPDTSGIALTHVVRATVMGKNVPIVAMTSHTEQEYKDKCREAGMNGYSNKPLSPQDLQAIIEKYVMLNS